MHNNPDSFDMEIHRSEITPLIPAIHSKDEEIPMKEEGEVVGKAGNRMKRVISGWWTKEVNENYVTVTNIVEAKQETYILKNDPEKIIIVPYIHKISWFWTLLGFEGGRNPLHVCSIHNSYDENLSAINMSLSMLSTFSTCYNMVSISQALHMMKNVYPEMTVMDESLCSSILIGGMVVGQLTGGSLGDLMGRKGALNLVMLFQVFGSIASAFSQHVNLFGTHVSIFHFIAVCRFMAGLGCGGAYPLAGTLASESATKNHNRARLVGFVFCMQGVGFFAAPYVAYLLLCFFGEHFDMSWRFVLGFGAIPGIAFLIFKVATEGFLAKNEGVNNVETSIQKDDRRTSSEIWRAIKTESDLISKLLGTAVCWFLIDVTFYGNVLFQPIVFSSAFGSVETLRETARDATITSFMSMPGYFVTVSLIGRLSPKQIQMWGFAAISMLYVVVATFFDDLKRDKNLLLFLYGLTFFFTNFGPNTTTYILPPMTYSKPCRATLNGVCCASGKTGAFLASFFFGWAVEKFGQRLVLMMCSSCGMIGFFLSHQFVADNVGMGES